MSVNKVVSALAALLALAVSTGCATMVDDESTTSSPLATTDTVHTHTAVIMADWDGMIFPWCSGFLVAPDVLVTAGHCTFGVPSFLQLKVAFVDEINPYLIDSGQIEFVNGTPVTHPDFEPIHGIEYGLENDIHDVGVLLLDEPVTDIAPAQLAPVGTLNAMRASRELMPGDEITAVGYGINLAGHGNPALTGPFGIRQSGQLPFRGITSAGSRVLIEQPDDGNGMCFGDSGGPGMVVTGGEEVVVTLNSFVNGSDDCSESGWLYRVDTQSSRDFIDQFIN